MNQTKTDTTNLTEDAILNAIPATEAEFLKLILGSPTEFPIPTGIIQEVLKEHHEALAQFKGVTPTRIAELIRLNYEFHGSQPPTPKNQKAKVLWEVARSVIDGMSDYPRKRDAILSVINSQLGEEHKVSGNRLRRLAAEIAAGRTAFWDCFPIWSTSHFRRSYAKKLKDVPAELLKLAEGDYKYWAVRASLSEHVLWNDMEESISDEIQGPYRIVDELVLLHVVRRILAHVPAGKDRDEMIAACNTNITRHSPATGEVLARLEQDANALKAADAERKKEAKKKYVISWTFLNAEKSDTGEPQHGQDSYKSLEAAKEALWQNYSDLKAEIDEGGGYFESYENEISIDDDVMSYRSSGLVESEQEIRAK